jgi:DNA-3-methyladenine glycosylase
MTPTPLTARAIARLRPLPRAFYARDPRTVARELLGKLLIRRQPGPPPAAAGERVNPTLLAARIVEAEAYLGLLDPGSHAYRGLTPRNAVLFGPPGHAYIYFIYGNHYCTNISCQPAGVPGCVLLRALEPVCGIATMAALRGLTLPQQPRPAHLRLLTSGPGRLSVAFAITRARDNAGDLCSPRAGLYLADDGAPVPEISATPRINVTHAPHDEWRFLLAGNPFVSGKKMR